MYIFDIPSLNAKKRENNSPWRIDYEEIIKRKENPDADKSPVHRSSPLKCMQRIWIIINMIPVIGSLGMIELIHITLLFQQSKENYVSHDYISLTGGMSAHDFVMFITFLGCVIGIAIVVVLSMKSDKVLKCYHHEFVFPFMQKYFGARLCYYGYNDTSWNIKYGRITRQLKALESEFSLKGIPYSGGREEYDMCAKEIFPDIFDIDDIDKYWGTLQASVRFRGTFCHVSFSFCDIILSGRLYKEAINQRFSGQIIRLPLLIPLDRNCQIYPSSKSGSWTQPHYTVNSYVPWTLPQDDETYRKRKKVREASQKRIDRQNAEENEEEESSRTECNDTCSSHNIKISKIENIKTCYYDNNRLAPRLEDAIRRFQEIAGADFAIQLSCALSENPDDTLNCDYLYIILSNNDELFGYKARDLFHSMNEMRARILAQAHYLESLMIPFIEAGYIAKDDRVQMSSQQG